MLCAGHWKLSGTKSLYSRFSSRPTQPYMNMLLHGVSIPLLASCILTEYKHHTPNFRLTAIVPCILRPDRITWQTPANLGSFADLDAHCASSYANCLVLPVTHNDPVRFWSRYECGDPTVQFDLIAFAKTKLAPLAVDDPVSQLAVLDIRLLLTFEPTNRARQHEQELVRSYMRLAYTVPKHREYMYSGYSSEPVLAEAAASCWEDMRKAHGADAIVSTLLKAMNTGLLGKGERGELVARLLLTLAFDAAVKKMLEKGNALEANSIRYTRPVPLSLFLCALLGEKNYERIANSQPDHGDVGFAQAFQNAHVRFTHFARTGDSTFTTTKAAYGAILRSMALQCYSGQKSIDIVIPIALDDTLQESAMSAILISVKDRIKHTPRAGVSIRASELGFFPRNQSPHPTPTSTHGRPYIAIVMELGVAQARESRSG